MASQRPESGEVAVKDLESTAKLPVLDVAALDDLVIEDEAHLRTTVLPPDAFSTSDTHPGIPILRESTGLDSADVRVVVRAAAATVATEAAASTDESRAAADAQEAVGQLLNRQVDLLREIQEVREEAEARYQRLESDLDAARRLGEDLDAMRREAEARTLVAERRSAALEAEFVAAREKLEAEGRAAVIAARESLEGEALAARGRHEAELDTALQRQRSGLAALEQQHDAAMAAEAQQHVAALAALAQLHDATLAALRQQLSAEHEATRSQSAVELAALRAQLADQAAAHGAALQEARAEAAERGRQLDALRALKALDEAALARSREEVAALGSSLEDSRSALALAERDARLASAGQDREIEQLRAGLAELTGLAAAQVEALQAAESRRGIWASLLGDAESKHDEQLREAQHSAETRAEELRASLLQAEATLAAARGDAEARGARLAALEADLATQQQHQRMLEERAATATAQAETSLARGVELEQRLQALQSRLDVNEPAMRAELEALREERDMLRSRNATLTDAIERAAVAESNDAAVLQADTQQALQGELRRSAERVGELESDLRAAEDQINRLEGELRVKSSRLDEMSRGGWSATGSASDLPSISGRRRDEFASRGRGLADVGSNGESVLPSDSAFSGAGAAASADGVTRYFVLMDGDTEIVHVLGRRTTIGRGLDNDVRIDTKFISRHHAVVLAGPNQTVVEDLRSTNGVLVNGRRVTRSVLRDGDIVHVGKTQFRFVQRSRDR